MRAVAIDRKTERLIEARANAKAARVTEMMTKICLTGLGLALYEVYGFRRKRLKRLVPIAEEYMTKTIAAYLADDVVAEKIERDYQLLFGEDM